MRERIRSASIRLRETFHSEKYFILFFCALLATLIVQGCSICSAFISPELPTSHVEPIATRDILQSLFLIGDAGEPSLEKKEPTLAALEANTSLMPEQSTIVFLGDNIYPQGMPEQSNNERRVAELRLDEQVKVVERSGATGIFIPGNHDWGHWSSGGLENLKRQEEYIHARKDSRVLMSPRGGSPGPEVFDIGDRIRLVTLDTEWWLNGDSKPLYPGLRTEEQTKTAVIDSLSRVLRTAGGRYVIVVGHHPLDSHGEHSGFFDWKDHIFPFRDLVSWLWIPLPGIGSIYPLARMFGATNQDFSGSRYKEMRQAFFKVFIENPPLLYAAGHEHTLEVLKSSGEYFILVSGFGTSQHNPSLTHSKRTLFAHRQTGFMRIDLVRDGRVRISVLEPANNKGEITELFSMWLVIPD